MQDQLRHGARDRRFPVDVCAEQLARFHCCFPAWELFHGADLLFPVALAISVTEYPNIRASVPLLSIKATLLIASAH